MGLTTTGCLRCYQCIGWTGYSELSGSDRPKPPQGRYEQTLGRPVEEVEISMRVSWAMAPYGGDGRYQRTHNADCCSPTQPIQILRILQCNQSSWLYKRRCTCHFRRQKARWGEDGVSADEWHGQVRAGWMYAPLHDRGCLSLLLTKGRWCGSIPRRACGSANSWKAPQ